jgi:hypothetical protein
MQLSSQSQSEIQRFGYARNGAFCDSGSEISKFDVKFLDFHKIGVKLLNSLIFDDNDDGANAGRQN